MSVYADSVRAMYQAFQRGDVDALLSHVNRDVDWEYERSGDQPKYYKPRHGRDAVPSFFFDLQDFEFQKFEPEAILEGVSAEGDPIAVGVVNVEAVGKRSGMRIRDITGPLFTFDRSSGLVKRFRHLGDTHQFALAGV